MVDCEKVTDLAVRSSANMQLRRVHGYRRSKITC